MWALLLLFYDCIQIRFQYRLSNYWVKSDCHIHETSLQMFTNNDFKIVKNYIPQDFVQQKMKYGILRCCWITNFYSITTLIQLSITAISCKDSTMGKVGNPETGKHC